MIAPHAPAVAACGDPIVLSAGYTRTLVITAFTHWRQHQVRAYFEKPATTLMYLTHTRLMRESERTVHETAMHGTGRERRVCGQLVSDPAGYSRWYASHDHRMQLVGRLLRRESQLLELRRGCVEELHRAALVRYLNEFNLPSEERDRTLRVFYGVMDPREAAVLEHRRYLMAASSQLCATELLALAGDTLGVDLIRRYERAYAQYFSLFCERARRSEAGQRCLLGELLPEVKAIATRLHEHIVGRDLNRRRTAGFAPRSVAAWPRARAV